MDTLILVAVMALVGVVLGALADRIWRDERPYGLGGDVALGAVTAIVVGLIDWFVIPAIGFSQTIVLVGVALEPPLAVLLVLWIVRRAKR